MSARFDLDAADFLPVPGRKRYYNERHFGVAAPRYDLATRFLSLGRDSAWKRALAAALPDLPSPVCVDLACGTGDLVRLLARKYPAGRVVGLDLTAPMLALASRDIGGRNVRYTRQDMCAVGIADGSVSVVTGSYALRNAPDLGLALDEVRRILAPGGTAAFLDFSKASNRIFRAVELRVLKAWGGFWGLVLHGNHRIHGYVAASLAAFPDRAGFHGMLCARGLEISATRSFFLGIVGLTVVRKRPVPARPPGRPAT